MHTCNVTAVAIDVDRTEVSSTFFRYWSRFGFPDLKTDQSSGGVTPMGLDAALESGSEHVNASDAFVAYP